MIYRWIHQLTALFVLTVFHLSAADAQNSLLVNFGSASCSGSGAPGFSLITNPLTDTAANLITCSLANQVPDIFAVFIAYNPKDNKIYVADIRSGNTKIWLVDLGLPSSINCPVTLDSTPNFTYSYVSNNFEFDNNGNLWSFSAYNDSLGQCSIDNFDVSTGQIISTRIVQFPPGNFPTTISSGDITILPNGRMFATLGSFPSKLYEIHNYNQTTSATAVFLDSLPQSCFGIAYLNGKLEITGTDFSGTCYYYNYDIATATLDSVQSFQDGQLPIDNTSITPSVGVTNQLAQAAKVNENTADITYNIFVKNLGNVSLNNINVNDNLAPIYGAANVSGIQVSFLPGQNAANLLLNPAYDGVADTALLLSGQTLNNQTSVNSDYFFELRVSCRVTGLNPGTIYLNSAIGKATIGSAGTTSYINVADSSNNGPPSAVDPNNDGNATEPGENVPTPFNFGILPVVFIGVNATLSSVSSATVSWAVATPTLKASRFEVEFSQDTRAWTVLGTVPISNTNESSYRYVQTNIPQGNLFYRIKETDIDGAYVYSNIVALHHSGTAAAWTIFPNPASDYLTIAPPASGFQEPAEVLLYDATGRLLTSALVVNSPLRLETALYPEGTYVLKFVSDGNTITTKVLIMHR